MTGSINGSIFYKDLTLLQMRSFVAAARLGSLSSAARSLQIAQPTVWKQIHALEERLGCPLVETHARGCRLTAEGRILESLLQPIVSDIASLQSKFEQAVGQKDVGVRIAASPRIIDEDLPDCVAAFKKEAPNVAVTLCTATNREVADLVAAGKCDLGFTDRAAVEENPSLSVETVYELDVLLLTPRKHALARRRSVDPGEIARHPMVTAPTAIANPKVNARLQNHRVFASPASVQALTAAGIRRYVRLGFGIGIIGGILSRDFRKTLTAEGLVARSLGDVFGRIPIVRVRSKATAYGRSHRLFDSVVRRTMKRLPQSAR